MNKRGFTLVEVIAVIAIIGFLALISVPAISRISAGNDSKAVETFEKTLKNSAKAYVNTTNEVTVSKSVTCATLQGKGYIKKCTIKGYTCSPSVMIRVSTSGTQNQTKTYSYEVQSHCRKN